MSTGLLLTDEEFWVEQRRFVLRHLRDFGFGRRTMAELVEHEAEHLVNYFKEKVGSWSLFHKIEEKKLAKLINLFFGKMPENDSET